MKTRFPIIWALALCFCVCWPECGMCSESQKEETITISKTDWIALQQNTEMLKTALDESRMELKEAKGFLTVSRRALNEAEAALEESERELATSKAELETLKQEYEKQKAELTMLRAESATLKAESSTASDALTKANQYLQDTKKEIEANEATHRKREAQLERQRLLWQLACLVVGGVAAAV